MMPSGRVIWTLILLLIPALRVPAQELAGTWLGTMQEGPTQSSRTVVTIAKAADGELNDKLYRIDEGAGPIPVSGIAWKQQLFGSVGQDVG